MFRAACLLDREDDSIHQNTCLELVDYFVDTLCHTEAEVLERLKVKSFFVVTRIACDKYLLYKFGNVVTE